MRLLNHKNPALGFTLIELLVVIVVIGILATIVTVTLGNIRVQARNSKRVADLKQMSTALQLYYDDQNNFPPTTAMVFGTSLQTPSNRVLMGNLPTNPSPRNDGQCPDQEYQYSVSADSQNYFLSGCVSQSVGSSPAGTVVYSGRSNFVCGDNVTYANGWDANYQYHTVAIGGQCWLTENINAGTRINNCDKTCSGDACTGICADYSPSASPVLPANNSIIERFCYANNEDYCRTYGGIYTWGEAMQYGASECNGGKCQGVCPSGWHIPTDAEWNTLEANLTTGSCDSSRNGAYDCAIAGDKIKQASVCTGGVSCASSGLNIQLGAFLNTTNGDYDPGYIDSQACYWTSTDSGTNAIERCIDAADSGTYRGIDDKGWGYYVRCIQN